MFRLVDDNWDAELAKAVALRADELWVIAPFIKTKAAKRLVAAGVPRSLRVITRFSLADMAQGVTDTAALRLLLAKGAHIRGVRNLHAKAYVFGQRRAIVTSANLTEAALTRNHELGFVADDPVIVEACRKYFDRLWSRAGANLDVARLDQWERVLAEALRHTGPAPDFKHLPDAGADVGIGPQELELPPSTQEVEQAFVKFFGQGHDRASWDLPVLTQLHNTGSHWACTYPLKRRPRSVRDGALMFFGQLVNEPNDIVVYGRGVAIKHDPERDVASEPEIKRRPWKAEWPNYIRVHGVEFVGGTLRNGISLNALMDELKGWCFKSTERRLLAGEVDVNPRSAYKQQAQVKLSPKGLGWLNTRLEKAFTRHGKIPAADLAGLDWPSATVVSPQRGRP